MSDEGLKKWKAGDADVPFGTAPAYYDLTDEYKSKILGRPSTNRKLYPIRPECRKGKMLVFGKMMLILSPEHYSKAVDYAIWDGWYAPGNAHTVDEAVEMMLIAWAKTGGIDVGREWSLKNDSLANVFDKFGEGKLKELRLAHNATKEQRADLSRASVDILTGKE